VCCGESRYRNTIKALNWFSSVREKLDDPRYASWFVKFAGFSDNPYPGGEIAKPQNGSYHVPVCDWYDNGTKPRCSGFYHVSVYQDASSAAIVRVDVSQCHTVLSSSRTMQERAINNKKHGMSLLHRTRSSRQSTRDPMTGHMTPTQWMANVLISVIAAQLIHAGSMFLITRGQRSRGGLSETGSSTSERRPTRIRIRSTLRLLHRTP
jgi:hypothetical protein